MSAAEEMQEKLGPALCLAKWKQTSLHLTTGHTNSCYHPPLHKIRLEDIQRTASGLHNTEYKKQQRQMMLQGQRPAECQYCWNMEDLGELSDRHYRSGEPWAAVDFDAIVAASGDEDVIPSYVEVNFSHGCNLKCSYCSPQYSSTWQAEVERHGAYPTSTPHNAPEYFVHDRKPIPNREHNPYVDTFWEWWPSLYPRLQHFRMTGGEPLMDRNTYRVFDYVLAMPKPDLHLNVTSNFSVEPELWIKYIDYVKRLCSTNIEHFMQYVSLDSGIKEHAEYIRHGLSMGRLKSYVDEYLHRVPGKNSLTFIITMNNLSVLGLQRLLEYILELRQTHSKTYQKIWFDTPLLRQPTWQSLQLLPPVYSDILERTAEWMELNQDPMTGFRDYEIQRLRRDIAWMREGEKLDPEYVACNKADFYRFFAEHDRRRDTGFERVFWQMKSWWKECEFHARQS